MSEPRWRRASGDDGFTLVEMIVTVAIMGVISFALFGVVLEYLKVNETTESRLSESTDQQFVSTYWQADVSSLGRRVFDDSNATFSIERSVYVGGGSPDNCGAAVGVVVVAFAWPEFLYAAADANDAWKFDREEVAYVSVQNGDQYVLKRVRCTNNVADPAINVAHTLVSPPTVDCDPSCNPAGELPTRVSLTMHVQNVDDPSSGGYTTVLTADRRQG